MNLVNQLYSKKISETHPLYREYRQAIRLRHDDQALRVLQSIRRINHDDANAHAEFARLARKIYERRRVDLAGALDREEVARALELMEGMEADDLPGRDEDPTWQRAVLLRDGLQRDAAKARCLELAGQLRQLKAQNRWQDTLPALSEWEALRGQHKIALPPEIEEDAAAVRKWATGLLNRRERTQERQRAWNELSARLDELDRVPPAQRTRKAILSQIDELTAQAQELAAQGNDGNGNTPPPDLVERLNRHSALLVRQLRQRKTAAAGLMVAATLLVIGSVAWGIHLHLVNGRRQSALAAIEQHYKDGATDTLATLLKSYDADFGGTAPNDAGTKLLGQARDFVQNHQAALERFNKELEQIKQSAEKPGPGQIAGLLASLDQLGTEVGDLGADDAERAKAAIQAVQLHLNQLLAGNQEARLARLADIFARAEQIATDKLGAAASAIAVQAAAAQAGKILAEANEIPADLTLATPAEEDARTKLSNLAGFFDAKAAAAHDALTARAQLAQARSLADYCAILNTLAPNPLSGDPAVASARELLAKNPDWADVAQEILLPGDPQTWAFLAAVGDARLAPAESNNKENVGFEHLVHNEALGNTYRADLVTYVDGREMSRDAVFLAGKPDEKPPVKNDQYTEIVMSGKIIQADGTTPEKSTRWIQFIGQKSKGDRFENVQLAAESKLAARLATAYDNGSGAIREPLLRVLDDVRADTASSPLLKAYLEQEILKIMQNRPRDWGLAFSPTALKDAGEFARITLGPVNAAGWLYATANSGLTNQFKAFYAATGGTSYYNEALANLQSLIRKRALVVRFAGYVELDGSPRFAGPPPGDAIVWGLNDAGTWQALFAVHGEKAATAAGNPSPAHLTPLLYPVENGAP